jgi:hypothetical protein
MSSKDKNYLHALSEAVSYYEKATLTSELQNPYPLTNWLILLKLKLLSEGKTGIGSLPLKARKAVDELQEKYSKETSGVKDFWTMTNEATLKLTQFLIGGSKVEISEIQSIYEMIWKMAGNKGHKIAEIENLEIIGLILTKIDSKHSISLNEGISDLMKNLKIKV